MLFHTGIWVITSYLHINSMRQHVQRYNSILIKVKIRSATQGFIVTGSTEDYVEVMMHRRIIPAKILCVTKILTSSLMDPNLAEPIMCNTIPTTHIIIISCQNNADILIMSIETVNVFTIWDLSYESTLWIWRHLAAQVIMFWWYCISHEWYLAISFWFICKWNFMIELQLFGFMGNICMWLINNSY